jgi:hypothetical protein
MKRFAGLAALIVVTLWAFWPTAVSRGAPGERVAPGDAYNPVVGGEPLPDGFRQLLPRDAISPIYEPMFVPGSQAGWPRSAHVIGVAAEGEAKAYPVSFLTRREMVIDSIAGIPILVTW